MSITIATRKLSANRETRIVATKNRRQSTRPIDFGKLTIELAEIRNRLRHLETKIQSASESSLGIVPKPTARNVTASDTRSPMTDRLSTLADQIMELLDQTGPMTVSTQLRDLWKQLDEREKLGAFAMALGAAKIARDRSRFVAGTSKIEPDPEAYAEVIAQSLF